MGCGSTAAWRLRGANPVSPSPQRGEGRGEGGPQWCSPRSLEDSWPLLSPFFALLHRTAAEHRRSAAERLVASAPARCGRPSPTPRGRTRHPGSAGLDGPRRTRDADPTRPNSELKNEVPSCDPASRWRRWLHSCSRRAGRTRARRTPGPSPAGRSRPRAAESPGIRMRAALPPGSTGRSPTAGMPRCRSAPSSRTRTSGPSPSSSRPTPTGGSASGWPATSRPATCAEGGPASGCASTGRMRSCSPSIIWWLNP
jgi:hypothetical protein